MISLQLKSIITIVGIIISLFGTINYIRSILANNTKPHIYTWIVWLITQSIAVAGMWVWGGSVWSRWPTIGLVGITVVVVLSIKYWTKDITKSDTWSLLGCFIAMGLRLLVQNPLRSVISVTIIDVLWYIPSMRKTFINPQSETLLSWIISCVCNLLTILSFVEYNVLTLLYICVIFCCSMSMVWIIVLRRRTLSKQTI